MVTYNTDPYQPISCPELNSAIRVGFTVAMIEES